MSWHEIWQKRKLKAFKLWILDTCVAFFFLLTQEWDGFQHGADLLHRTLSLTPFMAVAAKTVDPPQQPSSVHFGFFVKFFQQLHSYGEVILKTFVCPGWVWWESMLKNRQRNIHTCFFTCFWAPSAMRSFMLNLQSFTNVSMSPAGSPEPSTSMLSDGAWPLSFSLILSKKKHLKRREKNKVVSGSVICLYFKKKKKKKNVHNLDFLNAGYFIRAI